jgi:serine/threonine protein kinase/tetratricopeptide (TPR) repeat protein
MTLQPGTQLGNYTILSLLGVGGMGEVYKALDVKLNRFVAIKVLLGEVSHVPELRTRLRREARAAAAVTHPRICTLYQIAEQGDLDFLVMEYLEGETLAVRIARGPLPFEEVIGIGIEIGEALAAAHTSQLIHRDLKPGNIMLTRHGAKLLDFGIAKLRIDAALRGLKGESRTKTLTAAGELIGTLQYMAPEQLQHDAVDSRTDLFAFGAVMYEAVTGIPAFERRTVAETIAAIIDGSFTPLRTARPDTPMPLARIVTTCLATDALARWQTASDLTKAFKAVARRPARSAVIEPGLTPTLTAGRPQIRSLVVLPFEVTDIDETEHYLAEGLTESLIQSIPMIAKVKVISRGSAVRLRTNERTIAEIGRELRVDGVIRGTVSLSPGRILVTVELLHAESGDRLWSDSLERPQQDMFTVQWQIAETIAAELNLRLTLSDRRRRRPRRAPDPEANQAYLQGRYFWNRDTPDSLQRSFRYLNVAVQRDPGYAPFHAALADWYLSAGNNGLLPAAEAIAKGKLAALRARELDPDLAQAYSCLGRIAMQECDLKRARAEFDNAFRLDPNLVEPLVWSSRALSFLGMHDEAIARLKLAKQLDPVSPRAYAAAAAVYYAAGDYRQSMEESRAALELDPHLPTAFYFAGVSQFSIGETEKAIETLQTCARESQRHPASLSALVTVLAHAGRRVEAEAIVEELRDRATRGEVSPYHFAETYLGLGDTDRALEYLRRSHELNLPDMIGLFVDPLFRPLRGNAAFERLLRDIRGAAG